MKPFKNGISIEIDATQSLVVVKQYYDAQFTLYVQRRRIWVELISKETGKTKAQIGIDLEDFQEVMTLVDLLCPQEV